MHEYRSLTAWWGDAAREWQIPVQQPVLVHGDLWYGNILVDAECQTILGILDFENAASDLAPQYYLGDEFLQAVVDGFQMPGSISDLSAHLKRLLGLCELMGLAYGPQVGEVDEDAVAKIRGTTLENR